MKPSSLPKINFNPELFNEIFWELKEAIENPLLRYIYAFGGSSASKTYSFVQLTIIKMLEGNDENTLILRKFAVDIKDSIYSDFKTVISDWGLSELFTIQQNYILCKTGSFTRFRGLDDSEKIKGISGFKRVALEEISQFEEVDLKQIRKRLRGKAGQKIIGLFNPISEEHWIKQKIFDTEDLQEVQTKIAGKWTNGSNLLVLKTNYLDNVFIVGRWKKGKQVGGFVDQHVIDDFEKDKKDDFDYYSVYGLGNWGRLRTGGEFWKDLNPNIHFKEVKYNPDLPIHMYWDDNVNPYLPCSLWQIDGLNLTQIDEIALADPLNRVRHVCAEFMRRYPVGTVQGLFIGGDRTAIKEDTKLEKGENFYTEILSILKDYRPHFRMPSSNPSVVKSGEFVNECYAGRQPINIVIGINNKKSIYDYRYVLEDSDGTIKKTVVKNKITKVSYQEFGHFSDIKRYVVTMSFPSEYARYLSSNKGVRIRMGRTSLSK